jgi:ABC-type nitrate/sulfonate/bicarbonate transport system substrate-binding protein
VTKKSFSPSKKAGRTLRVGFVPLNDCAPLVMAQELGLFGKYGVEVELSREVGWATIRDKIIYGELDAAHAVAGLVYACNFGLGCIQKDCLTGLVLNLHGNAITLSKSLLAPGVRDAATLKSEIERTRQSRTLTFGVVSQVSSHHFLMRRWLLAGGLDPDKDVRIVVVPPPQMFANLKAGHIDGYCVGEPWNSLAVMSGAGFCVATSEELAPMHPEKILLVQKRFAQTREAEHLALIAALIEACAFCDRPENRERIAETLAEPHYVGAPIEALRMSMMGRFHFTRSRIEKTPNFNVFARLGANTPTPEKAQWVLHALQASGVIGDPAVITPNAARAAFHEDIFQQAHQLVQSTSKTKQK